MSKETMERLKMLKDEMKDQGGVIKDVSENEEVALRKEISLKLLQLAPESLDDVLKDLKKMCDDLNVCQIIVEMVIIRAWSQQKYSKLYAELIVSLGNKTYPWAEGEPNSKVAMENSKKKFKSLVIQKIKKEFLDGFNNFKAQMIKLDRDDTKTSDDKFNTKTKAKKKLKGNINFISELYLQKYLPHKVIRFICYKLTLEFIKESIKYLDEDEIGTLQTPMHEEYAEALVELLSNSGARIEQKEKKLEEKSSSGDNAIMIALVNHLVKNFQNRSFVEENIKNVISDDQRRNMNAITYSFEFMKRGKEANIFGIRLGLLMENLFEQKRNNWVKKIKQEVAKTREEVQREYEEKQREKDKGSRGRGGGYYDDYGRGNRYERRRDRRDDEYEIRGRRRDVGGGRKRNTYSQFDESPETKPKRTVLKSTNTFSGLQDDDEDDEYEKVPNARSGASKVDLEALDKQINSFFKANSKESNVAHVAEFFSRKNPDFKTIEYGDILKLYLTHCTQGWESAVLMRAEYARKMFEEFDGDLETFVDIYQECYEENISSDVPSYKKAYAILLAQMIQHEDFRIEELSINVNSGDMAKDYGMAEGYQGLFEALKNLAKDSQELG